MVVGVSQAPEALDIPSLQRFYRDDGGTVEAAMEAILAAIETHSPPYTWIDRVPAARLLERARALDTQDPTALPLYGVPFALKDNIDYAGVPTTAACPAYAYTPSATAPVVQRLEAAGAVYVGKTNMDQFATGLVGTRSPYGACHNLFDPAYIAGGSSSGSAVAVAAGLVSFALGTDTAGSGRVPAAFNNLVGLKPSRGLVSTRGVVPACHSLDCVSIFALTVEDARRVGAEASGYDPAEPFSRDAAPVLREPLPPVTGRRIGIPARDQLAFFGDTAAAARFDAVVDALKGLGLVVEPIDFGPFQAVGQLLYEGPWVAERYRVFQEILGRDPESILPTTRAIVSQGGEYSAADLFEGYYTLRRYKQSLARLWQGIDALLTPTAGTIYTLDEVAEEPIRRNRRLGYYSEFVNLLDLAAVAVPAGFTPAGLPFGVTLSGPAFREPVLCALGEAIHHRLNRTRGATDGRLAGSRAPTHRVSDDRRIELCVVGAHMRGLSLNHQLVACEARFQRATRTAPRYRLYALDHLDPVRPGMLRDDTGAAIQVEIWDMPLSAFGGFVQGIAPPLGIGTVELEDGHAVQGFLCEPYALTQAQEITELGGWRGYLGIAEAP